MPEPHDEIRAIEVRYARRKQLPEACLYHPLDHYVCYARQERERAFIRCLKRAGQVPVHDKRVLEVGCGGGTNLIDLIRLGFQPQNLVGNDLLEERLARARTVLPPAVALILGDAPSLALEEDPSISSCNRRFSLPFSTRIFRRSSRAECGPCSDRVGEFCGTILSGIVPRTRTSAAFRSSASTSFSLGV